MIPSRPRLVEPAAEVPAEFVLRQLFAAEDSLLAAVARVRAEQREARAAYAKERGLLILPSMAKLREVLG